MNSMVPSDKIIKLFYEIEEDHLSPYLCSAGVPTISVGVTYYENGTKVKLSDPRITKERSKELFLNTLKEYTDCVNRVIKTPMSQNQFDAFLLMCYNCGIPKFSRPAQVVKWFNLNNINMVQEWWLKSFITSANTGDAPVKGLINRRKCELDIFNKEIYKKW